MAADTVTRNVRIDEDRRPLQELSRTNPEAIPIGKTLVIGTVSLLVGILFAWAALSPQGLLRSEGAPVTPLVVLALTFLLPGAALAALAIGLIVRRLRRARGVPGAATNAGRAARDFPWKPEGMTDVSSGELWGFFYGISQGLFFFVPLQAAFLATGGWSWMLKVGALLIDICIVAAIARLVLRRAGAGRFGPVRLRFPRFPLRPDGRFEAELLVPNGLADADSLHCTLRYVVWEREVAFTGRAGEPGSPRIEVTVPYQEWAVSWDIPLEKRNNPRTVPLAVDLPTQCPETCLAYSPPRYWELEVATDSGGIDYSGKFPVPVYRS